MQKESFGVKTCTERENFEHMKSTFWREHARIAVTVAAVYLLASRLCTMDLTPPSPTTLHSERGGEVLPDPSLNTSPRGFLRIWLSFTPDDAAKTTGEIKAFILEKSSCRFFVGLPKEQDRNFPGL
jgi:hypothetical protein